MPLFSPYRLLSLSFVLLSAGLGFAADSGAEAVGGGRDYYVAPDGNDAHEGSKAEPFASIPRAMAAVRELRLAENPVGPVTVFLRGGVYPLAEKLVFTPADSGTSESPVTYRSQPGERAVLSGGRRLSGSWQRTPGKPYYELLLPEVRDGNWHFFSLYVNGQSRIRARTPNWGQKVLRADGRAPGVPLFPRRPRPRLDPPHRDRHRLAPVLDAHPAPHRGH